MSAAPPLSHTLATPDGETLAVFDWPAASGAAPRGAVLIVHGLGEHARRYGHVAERLLALGFAVRAFDHHGHGASSGAQGGLPTAGRLLDDLALVAGATRRAHPQLPLVLLGHSMGGLVAASFVARGMGPVDTLVLSSPALDPGIGRGQRLLIATMLRIAPGLRVGNGLDVDGLSHDRAVVRAYREDPLTHDRIGPRLASFIADEGHAVQAAAPRWAVPTLLVYAGDDRLVKPAGSAAFAAAAPSSMVEAHCFPAHFHELFNELEAEPVFAALESWLRRRAFQPFCSSPLSEASRSS